MSKPNLHGRTSGESQQTPSEEERYSHLLPNNSDFAPSLTPLIPRFISPKSSISQSTSPNSPLLTAQEEAEAFCRDNIPLDVTTPVPELHSTTQLWKYKLFALVFTLLISGSGTIVIIQETILAHWFKGSSLSLAIALQISTSRLSSFLSMGTAVPIAEWVGFYGAAFFISAVVCVLSFIANILYCYGIKKIQSDLEEDIIKRLLNKNNFNRRWILLFPVLYWLLLLDAFILSSGWTSFLHINSEFIKLKFRLDDAAAAWNASISQLVPVILVPFLGIYIDRSGRRSTLLITSSFLFLACIVILGYTGVSPIISMLLFSISLAIGPVCLITAITLVLPSKILGTGLGLYKSSQNVGSTIVDIWVGKLQDTGERIEPSVSDYDKVLIFYIFWNTLALITSKLIYTVEKRYYHSVLSVDQHSRKNTIQILEDTQVIPTISSETDIQRLKFSLTKNFSSTFPTL
ncbi:hypothetical protein BB560_002341 [Smittium megazygosporum]|uniref:Lysosomal dipeptide transporter MFSD1 n=1 Tax=Smittium megazygosporum TaxID=133381 RepID=A0A2T9ZF16_9FUNG|nr:hypothetical protein BB560_002341 [Smittium megazygosporum]